MKKTYLFSVAIAMFAMTFLTTNLTAQVYNPPGQTSIMNHGQNEYGLLLNTMNNIHFDAPNISNIRTGIGINGNNANYGARIGVDVRTTSNASTGQSSGVSRGRLGFASDWNANGGLLGVSGVVDSVNVLNTNVANKPSFAIGGNFSARIFDPIQSTGDYVIAGTRTILDGNISTYPNTGVVAALYAEDRIKGSQTWAGHFDGRGYFSNKVGIKTLNPASDLSVNGVGDAKYTSYFYTNSTTNGNRAVFAEAAQPSGFADHIRAISGRISSGSGYAYGVSGDATNNSPSNAGRAYGVFGVAGNATPGANYGVYGAVNGTNGGTGVFGYDQVNFEDQNAVLMPPGTTWAGYFLGNSYFSNKVNVGTHNMPAMTTLGGKDYLMYVGGGGLFEEVKVLTGWADYVFENNYELTSLENVEAHIQEKGYLHNTPSATEIEENGLELGAITINQQEKIEELYLHLIEMNKTMKALQLQNEALIEKVNLLEKR